VLVVRGDGGRDWLAARLRDAGAEVDFIAAYRRETPRPDAEGRAVLAAALAAPGAHVWLFSSSEAIDNLAALAGEAHEWRAAHAVATHPRIAERAQALGIGDVRACRPDVDAVVACLQSFEPAPPP
jgi:uroporphyrinogen-III synthase